MRHGGRRQAFAEVASGLLGVGRRWACLVVVGTVVLALSGPAGAGSGRTTQPADVPGTSWSGVVKITEDTNNFTYSGRDVLTLHLAGVGGTSCGAGCYRQPFD